MIEPRKTIRNLYRIKDFGEPREAFYRFDKNERAFAFSEDEFSGMLSSLSPNLITMYPDQNPLYDKLALFLNLRKEEILLTPGSDCAIKIIFETYIDPGDQVIFIDPTYAMVNVYSQMFGTKAVRIGYRDNLELKFDDLLKSISETTKLVYIANPNQPTGTILERRQFELLLETTQGHGTILVVDEAYYEFSSQDYFPLDYLSRYPNLFILRTFSKAVGLAAVRLGYIVSADQNIDFLYRVKSLFDINVFALKLGEYIIDNYRIVQAHVDAVRKSKAYFLNELGRLGFECINSHTNFLHIKMPEGLDIQQVSSRFKENGILVRTQGVGLPAVLKGCIRINMAPLEHMKRFLEVFKDVTRS